MTIKSSPQHLVIKELRRHRERNNITQKEVADRMEVLPCFISRIENDSKNPSLETLERYADALGVSLDIRICRQPASSKN